MQEQIREKPRQGEVWKHFKSKYYLILDVDVIHSETGEILIVYQALYDTFKIYARPIDMFMSGVDLKKYPYVKQKFRFEKFADSLSEYGKYFSGESN